MELPSSRRTIAVLFAICGLTACVPASWAVTADRYSLQDVIDYRTLTVLAPSGELETVRLIGIGEREERIQEKAGDLADSLLRDNERLELEFDEQHRDAQGRLLAYVWMVHRRSARWLAVHRISMSFDRSGLSEYWQTDGEDGLQFRSLNAELIRSGFARTAPQPPNTRYFTQLQTLEKMAADRRK